MNKKLLFLIAGSLTGIVFVSSLFDNEPRTILGSVWFFRIGFFIMSFTSFMSYYQLKKAEKNKP